MLTHRPDEEGADANKMVPAEVFACLQTGEFRILILPGNGFAFGGAPLDVPTDLIPLDLRVPNARLWVDCDEEWNVLRIWRRE